MQVLVSAAAKNPCFSLHWNLENLSSLNLLPTKLNLVKVEMFYTFKVLLA